MWLPALAGDFPLMWLPALAGSFSFPPLKGGSHTIKAEATRKRRRNHELVRSADYYRCGQEGRGCRLDRGTGEQLADGRRDRGYGRLPGVLREDGRYAAWERRGGAGQSSRGLPLQETDEGISRHAGRRWRGMACARARGRGCG